MKHLGGTRARVDEGYSDISAREILEDMRVYGNLCGHEQSNRSRHSREAAP